MPNLFNLLVLALSLASALLSYHVYTTKTGIIKNIAVYIMVATVVNGVALLLKLSGVLAEESIITDLLNYAPLVSAVMLLLVVLEISQHKK